MTSFLRKILWIHLLFAFCFPGSIQAEKTGPPLEKISLQLKWFHQFQFAGYYAAKDLGFYREAGLDVEILEGGPGIKVLDIVSQGRSQFGVLGSELLYHRAKGSDVVVLAPIMQHSIRTIIVRSDRGITSLHSLVNKTVMLNKSELPEFAAMFLNEGIDINALHILNKNKTANAKFIAGKVDAINGSMANQPYLFQQKQTPFHLIKPITYGIDFYGDTLFSTSALLKGKPEVVAAFMAASFKGWNYAFDHPEEIADLILKKYSQKKSKNHLMFEQQQLKDLIHPDLVEIGHNNPERWQKIADTYIKLGLVEKDFRLKGFFYTDYQKTKRAVWMTRLLWILALLSVLFALNFLWNFRLRKTVNKITKEIQESEENLRITLDSIGDAVIATDLSGNVMRMNPVAEHLTGWAFKEARGKPLTDIFHIIHSQTREPAENPVEKVLTHGRVVGLANHTALVAKDGTEYHISDSGAPIKDRQGNTIGVVMVFQDISRRMAAETQAANLERFPRENPNPVLRISPTGILLYANRGSGELLTHWGIEIGDPIPVHWEKRLADILEQNRVGQFEEMYEGKCISLVATPVSEMNSVNIYGLDITALKKAEQAKSSIIENTPVPMVIVNNSGRILSFNRKFTARYGYTLDHLANNAARWKDIYPDPVYREKINREWQSAAARSLETGKEVEGILSEIACKDGSYAIVESSIISMDEVSIIVMTDVTEQHNTSRLLQKSESKYRELVEGTNDLITSVDGSGDFLFVNKMSEKFIGPDPENSIGISAFQFIHPEDKEKTTDWFKTCVGEHLPGSMIENRQVNSRTGEIFHMLWTCNFHYDEQGRLKNVNSVARDITQRKRYEDALRESEKRFRDITMGMADWIWEIDQTLHFTYISQSVERVLGYLPEEMLGKTPFEFMAEDDSSNALALMTRIAANQEKLKDVEHWYIGKQGNRVCLLENGIPVFDDQENLKGYRGVNKNITPQKILEGEKVEAERHLAQALKMEAVGTISGGIAHDFNNILGIIIGNVELAMDDIPIWNQTRMNLEEIKTASLRARDVVKQLLSFSRKTEQLKKPMTLQPIIKESIKLLRSSIPTSIEIEIDISPDTGTIEADQTQIHQVLINLCTNAAHAMDENGGLLEIQLSEVQLDQLAISQFQEIAPGRYAQLTISDTGHGIDPALKAKIFDPYFTTKEIGKGTGMGLAVVIGIVRSHNGDISVYSEPGKGTTFKVLLPLIYAKETSETFDTQEIPKGEGRIFFIDDEPAMVKMGARVLGRLGYQVDTQTDPLKALKRIEADPFEFDLVITDMTMPHLTGDRLAQKIITLNPQLPVILCSGFSNKIDPDRARQIGITRYIDKPLNKSEMARAINEVLSNNR